MFDFFKYLYSEATGIDVNAVQKEKENKEMLFSLSTRILIWIIGFLYLILAGFSIFSLVTTSSGNLFMVIKFLILSIIDIICMICLVIRKRETEIVSAILIFLFIVIQIITSTITI